MKNFSFASSVFVLGTSLAVPLLALAQTGINVANIKSKYSDPIIAFINDILVPVLMAIALIVFLWGIYKYFIYGAANESEKAEGRWFALWGVIGFVIIVALWGIVNLFMGTLGLSAGGTAPKPPTIGGSTQQNTTGGSIQQTTTRLCDDGMGGVSPC